MPTPIPPLAVTAHTATSAAGSGLAALAQALRERRSGLRSNDFTATPLPCWIGRVDGLEQAPVPAEFAGLDCRNNRLAWAGLNQDGFLDAARTLIERHGSDRVAVVLGTSTGSIGATEQAYREDMAALSGGTPFFHKAGQTLEDVRSEHLGWARSVWANRFNFGIRGGRGDARKLRAHLRSLQASYDRLVEQDERKKMRLRIGKLMGGSKRNRAT